MASLNDDLGVQSAYRFRVVDEFGNAPSASDFPFQPMVLGSVGLRTAGADSSFNFRLPPQALQIHRNLRAEVLKDLNQGISIVTGGEGIGRIVLQGTHGVGAFKSAKEPSQGLLFRTNMVAFFQTFVNANEERGRKGKEGLRLIWEIIGGGFSNPQRESYLVWPESWPVDSRSAARPHSWEWSCTLLLLRPWEPAMVRDTAKLVSPAKLSAWASWLTDKISKVTALVKKAKGIVSNLNELKNKLSKIKNAVENFMAGAKEAIYSVTDLVRGSAQLGQSILKAISPADFMDTISTAVRGAVFEVRKFLGAANLTAQQFIRSGVVASSLTAPRTSSTSVPVAVALSPGDSLRAIAARTLGDSSRWPDLVKINNLEFPFVDFSGPGGAVGAAYAGKRVLGATSMVKIPLPATPGVVSIAEDPIGTDIPDAQAVAGTLVGGAENLVAALLRRLITPRGRIPWHPSYGSALPSMVGSSESLADVEDIRDEAIQTLKADPRVLGVDSVEVTVDGSLVDFSAAVTTPLGPLLVAGAVS